MITRFFVAFFVLVVIIPPAFSQDVPAEKYWIFFRDKSTNISSEQKSLSQCYPERTIQRRLKHREPKEVMDEYDVPVSPEYIRTIKFNGIEILSVSRWLNAVSARLTAQQKDIIRQLSFVLSLKPVARSQTNRLSPGAPLNAEPLDPTSLDYGSSYAQNAMINTPAAHQLGFSGQGVLIGMIDTGFNLDHVALRNVHVVDDSDFVENDKDVSENTEGKSTSSHGTYVLSAIAGNHQGRLIGTAYGASFLLARTEKDDAIGQQIEEDRWVSALEWLEMKGADIVSSSISFFDEFQYTSDNYSLSDLDGNTALTTRATNIAFDKGVLVFNSAGNMGQRGAGYLGTPSDGKKMIAVGAVYGDSSVTTFSSRGPTKDGRKKPDIAALGYNVRVVASDTSHYDFLSGTSLSTPLCAGLAALALEANPKWNVKQLYDAIRKTSDHAGNPSSTIGYGIPNALKAINYDPSRSDNPYVKNVLAYPNPSQGSTTISFQALRSSPYSISIYNSLGQYVATIADNEPASERQVVNRTWNGKNWLDREVSSGVYFFRITLGGKSTSDKLVIVK
jgi:subtilisin family serine protease